jgi:hypothetical protein
MINVNPNEIIKLVEFLAKHGVSKPDRYRFEVDPILDVWNFKIKLNVTYLPSGDKTTIVLDP